MLNQIQRIIDQNKITELLCNSIHQIYSWKIFSLSCALVPDYVDFVLYILIRSTPFVLKSVIIIKSCDVTECLLAYSSVIFRFLKMIKTKSLPLHIARSGVARIEMIMFVMWIWGVSWQASSIRTAAAKPISSLKIMTFLNMTKGTFLNMTKGTFLNMTKGTMWILLTFITAGVSDMILKIFSVCCLGLLTFLWTKLGQKKIPSSKILSKLSQKIIFQKSTYNYLPHSQKKKKKQLGKKNGCFPNHSLFICLSGNLFQSSTGVGHWGRHNIFLSLIAVFCL